MYSKQYYHAAMYRDVDLIVVSCTKKIKISSGGVSLGGLIDGMKFHTNYKVHAWHTHMYRYYTEVK